MSDAENTRLTSELRRQIRYAIDRSISEGKASAEDLFSAIIDLLEAPFVDSPKMEPSASVLMKALEALGAKAVGQVEYWRRKQMEFPGLEDLTDDDGYLQLPADIGPLLSGRSANGRYSEADWWLSTIREAAGEVAKSESSERTGGDLKAFAEAMIACAFEGGDAGGDFIQDKAVECGLLKETVFDVAVHTDPNGWAKNGDSWFVKTDALADFGPAALAVSSDHDLKMIDRLRRTVLSMGKSTWEIKNSAWDFEAREGHGESLVFREASANMLPFSTRTAICRAPKLMDSDQWEPVARYIAAASPAAVAALVKAHDALAWELKRVAAERDQKDLKLRVSENEERADATESRLKDIPDQVVIVKQLEWVPDKKLPNSFRAGSIFPGAYEIRGIGDDVEPMWRLTLPLDEGSRVYERLETAQEAAQKDYQARIGPALGAAAFPQGWQLVPKDPYPEVIAAWWRYKNGFHYQGEQRPDDTSDYGAYRAMLAAMPVYRWPGTKANIANVGVET